MSVDKLIFLDIDGVLNDHTFNKVADSCTIDRAPILNLNRIIEETGAWIVLSSAWRYIVHAGDMTPNGFTYMLRTHGLTKKASIYSILYPDELCAHCRIRTPKEASSFNSDGSHICFNCNRPQTRGDLVKYWAKWCPKRYMVIDDMDLGYTQNNIPFVKTDGLVGLTADDALAAIKILNQP